MRKIEFSIQANLSFKIQFMTGRICNFFKFWFLTIYFLRIFLYISFFIFLYIISQYDFNEMLKQHKKIAKIILVEKPKLKKLKINTYTTWSDKPFKGTVVHLDIALTASPQKKD